MASIAWAMVSGQERPTSWRSIHQKPGPLQAVRPQEIGQQAPETGGRGHQGRVGGRRGQGKEVGNIPGLGEYKSSRAHTLCWRVSSLLYLQDRRVRSRPERTWSRESWTVWAKTGVMKKPMTLTGSKANSHCRGQSCRPAQDPMLAMVVFRFMLRRAPAAASKSLQARSTLTISRGSSPRTWTSSMYPKDASLKLATQRRPERTASSRTR